ncbi:MAG TPA: group 1 truncated hemoglobin, partial [Steroidobacteraceae bacterium]|nr:group 1 truncated hemoglobin [Steroidobacteraceae bacterium]
MPHKSFLWGILACLLLPVIAGAEDTLYARFGGGERVQAIVNLYVDKVSVDPRTKRSFEKSDLKRIKRVLAEHLCALMNGPCTYEGDSMRDVHSG